MLGHAKSESRGAEAQARVNFMCTPPYACIIHNEKTINNIADDREDTCGCILQQNVFGQSMTADFHAAFFFTHD